MDYMRDFSCSGRRLLWIPVIAVAVGTVVLLVQYLPVQESNNSVAQRRVAGADIGTAAPAETTDVQYPILGPVNPPFGATSQAGSPTDDENPDISAHLRTVWLAAYFTFWLVLGIAAYFGHMLSRRMGWGRYREEALDTMSLDSESEVDAMAR